MISALQIGTHAQSKWSYPDCPDVTDADFKVDTLLMRDKQPDPNIAEPDKLAFDMDASGNVDVYFTEIRPGNIKRYNAKTKTVTTLATLPVWKGPYTSVNNSGNIEEGATGIALDPDFKTNGYVYIHWSPASATVFRISRFTLKNDKLDMASEKIVLDIGAQRNECCHTGGAMQFDAYGDLWIAQGANGGRGSAAAAGSIQGINDTAQYLSEEWGPPNTHNLRGGFLRIHPTPDGHYSIPSGNFGEYFYDQTKNAQYLDTSKVRPEVYIKGTRNNYAMALDPVRRWVLWGDVGPDRLTAAQREEFNLRKTPGFEGWPYFVGDNVMFVGNKNPAAPANDSKWNTGMKVLPPARATFSLPADFRASKMRTSPITGPLYLYDGALNSSVKLPPHFNRKWFVTDWVGGLVYVFDVDADGTKATAYKQIFANRTFTGPVDLRQGPDGALYLSNYSNALFGANATTSIMKISYTGTCRPLQPTLEKPVGLAQTRFDMRQTRSGYFINLGTTSALKIPPGMGGIELFDMSGKRVWAKSGLRAGEMLRMPSETHSVALKYRWLPTAL